MGTEGRACSQLWGAQGLAVGRGGVHMQQVWDSPSGCPLM